VIKINVFFVDSSIATCLYFCALRKLI